MRGLGRGKGRSLAFLLALACAAAAAPPNLASWRLEEGRLVSEPPSSDRPIPVGSLQKPFVARAWAESHPGEAPPRFTCGPGSGCWRKAGHGDLGLARAVAQSCNAYFIALARATPLEALQRALAAEGFAPPPRTALEAVGLGGSLAIRPSALLEAYRRLVREPWPGGEAVRAQVLEGLEEASRTGTARGIGHRGFRAKTGTIPSPDGDPLATCGLAVVVDGSGFAALGRLVPGTGREAAAALAAPLDRWRPWAPRTGGVRRQATPAGLQASVRVRLFELLGAKGFQVRNVGAAPVPLGRGFLGPGAAAALAPGVPAGPGLLEVSAPGVRRRFQGEVVLRDGRLLATVSPREYVVGVLAAEAPGAGPDLRAQLGAAVLRFLAKGPRHPGFDVCDTTHCAWYVGRGPRLAWTTPRTARERPGEVRDLPDPEWAAIQDAAQRPGPDQWTAHCGGAPLSPYALWGAGSREAPPCPRHPAPCAPWVRTWPKQAVERALGPGVEGLEAGLEAGVWVLRVRGERPASLRYDEAHRRLARELGWDALPSPADSVEAVPEGFRARGVGSGHRVGLCLAD